MDEQLTRESVVNHMKVALEHAKQEKAKASFEITDATARLERTSKDVNDLRRALKLLDPTWFYENEVEAEASVA